MAGAPETAPRRVVVTGIGVITPNGCDVNTFWANVSAGKSGAGLLTRFNPGQCPSRYAAEVKDWVPTRYMEPKVARRLERSHQFGLAAARNAATDAEVDFSRIDPDRCGIVEATSLSNMDAAYNARSALERRGIRAITPSMMIGGYVGSGSAEIATHIGLKGHAITCSSSSASGNDVLGYAMRMIQNEDVDLMIAGGTEAPIVDTVFFGFAQSHAMTRSADPPGKAMKPFDQKGDGFIMGEGGAYLVLEELSHALGRGAQIYGEVLGQGRSCEAYHPMAPHPAGAGVVRAMEKALRMAGVDPDMIDCVNVHGTANSVNDLAETRALKKLFGPQAGRLAVIATKPITGHALAAVGAVEAAICILAIQRQKIPPTLNLSNPLPECDLDYVQETPRPYPVRVAMSLNSGFGGKTSCLIVGRYPA